MPTVLRRFEKVARVCTRDGVDHLCNLVRQIELKVIDLQCRTVERQLRAARFAAVKTRHLRVQRDPPINNMLVLSLARF